MRTPPGEGPSPSSRKRGLRRPSQGVRRCVVTQVSGPWGMQPRKLHQSGCRALWIARRRRRLLRSRASRSRIRRGLRPRHATRGRTRHLGGPRFSSVKSRSNGEPVTRLRRAERTRMRARPAERLPVRGSAQNKHSRRGRPLARGDRSHGRRERGSRRAAYERGRRGTDWHPDPAEQRRPVLS